MAKKRKKGGKPAAKPAPKPEATVAKPEPQKPEPEQREPQKIEEKKSRGAQRRQAARADRNASATSTLGPAEEPRFWFGFEVPWAKLVLARVVVFALLAIDALRQIEHAPRYGAGDFNVAQLPLLDALAPGRVLYSVSELVLAYLFIFVACGVLTRYVLPIATVVYGWLYFSSHLDSYQHHYLVWLILLLACFVPWERPAGATATTPVRSWALRLIFIQLALLYFWAAVSKMNGAWVDGRTLGSQLSGGIRSLVDATVGIKGASWIVILVELTLAATIWNKRTWWIAAPLGIALHAGIVWTSLEIGLFAWLMLGLYILVIPDRVWTWVATRQPLQATREIAGVIGGWFDGAMQWLWWIIAGAIALLLAGVSRFDHGFAVGGVLIGVLLVASIVLRKRVSIAALASAQLLALVTWTAVDRGTMTASDYFRLWGGSAKRLGDPKTSEYAYRKMIEVAPNEGGGHYQLGKLLLDRKADDEGI
ncbi:MAG TPA: HTTM domain-containing protein, partial [Kofleriaceae bacterium]|nr:HTTM domain-containing protein [Kofleriaceae bacterium]